MNKRFMLVYQAGIANVFEVDAFNLGPYGRNARRLLQSDYRSCESFARGIAAAGGIVRTAACNRAGDIVNEKWDGNLELQPWSEKFQPVNSGGGV